jgi:shikimate dehydrogenase
VAEGEVAFAGAALVVNALSVQPDLDWRGLTPETAVMDMTYRPVETRLLAEARARGHGVVDGLAMLIGQAGPSFEALFGRPPPPLDLRPLLLEHLARTVA